MKKVVMKMRWNHRINLVAIDFTEETPTAFFSAARNVLKIGTIDY
jgi:hypothetical protein